MWLLQKAEKRAFQERKECVSSELILKEDKVKKKKKSSLDLATK